MKVLCAVLVVCLVAQSALATGAGRAFPLASENLAIQLFRGVNSGLEWDPTNFLVDLSGLYANCEYANGGSGTQQVDSSQTQGESVMAIVDNTYGEGMDVDSVNSYISHVLYSWMNNQEYRSVMAGAERFGCSVRPGCSGRVSVSCLFSPGNIGPNPQHPTPTPGQHALAFTDDQYYMAEVATGNRWDRSHFLENLSGFETSCEMIYRADWEFSKAIKMADDRGMRVLGLFGYAENRGQTQPAMEEVMATFKYIQASKVGCSVIPDCMSQNRMYVVVSCVYEEY